MPWVTVMRSWTPMPGRGDGQLVYFHLLRLLRLRCYETAIPKRKRHANEGVRNFVCEA